MRDTMGVIDQGTTRSSMDAGGQDPFEEITNKFNDSNFKPENALAPECDDLRDMDPCVAHTRTVHVVKKKWAEAKKLRTVCVNNFEKWPERCKQGHVHELQRNPVLLDSFRYESKHGVGFESAPHGHNYRVRRLARQYARQ